MDKHGYVKSLYQTALGLGYEVVDYQLLFGENFDSDNNTGVIVIKKNSETLIARDSVQPLGCPVTKQPMSLRKGHFYCPDSLLLYPVVNGIPCLLPENAIVATHYLD